ncbi:MAG TPA: aminotransferase class V-fold PLP-dependent enzyme, partial [Bacteroidia bacterium]|nr:aminotransferase class V-fold PLP-dependent enzyme [Bacteroidia bacterium]
SVVKAGDHAICVQKPYSWTNALLNKYLVNYGVTATMIDGCHIENFEKAIKPNTKLIYLESPNSLTFELQDIEAVSKLAHKHGISVVIDNSYSSPLCQKPLELGADLVLHSASKYIGGHSDLVAGVVCGSKARIENMFSKEFMNLGAIIAPNDAWLMIRSLRTLQLRIDKAVYITPQVVDALVGHPKIERIYYPFLKTNPQYELAKKQMKGSPGLFSVLLKTDIKGVERFCNSLKRFLMAVSWGGHESLVIPFCAISEDNRKASNLPENLVRFFIGIDEVEYLKQDILQALDKI